MLLRGRSLTTSMPVQFEATEMDLFEAIKDDITAIVELIAKVLEGTPPELASDIHESGIHLTGGGALLKGFAPLISDALKVDCHVAHDPLFCVAKGIYKAFKRSGSLLDGFEHIPR